jgi:hypothetical protein
VGIPGHTYNADADGAINKGNKTGSIEAKPAESEKELIAGFCPNLK